MSQITIRNIDPVIEEMIRSRSKKEHKSLSDVTNQLLKEALGLEEGDNKKRNLDDLAGSWSREEFQAFEKNQEIHDRIDTEVWE